MSYCCKKEKEKNPSIKLQSMSKKKKLLNLTLMKHPYGLLDYYQVTGSKTRLLAPFVTRAQPFGLSFIALEAESMQYALYLVYLLLFRHTYTMSRLLLFICFYSQKGLQNHDGKCHSFIWCKCRLTLVSITLMRPPEKTWAFPNQINNALITDKYTYQRKHKKEETYVSNLIKTIHQLRLERKAY